MSLNLKILLLAFFYKGLGLKKIQFFDDDHK